MLHEPPVSVDDGRTFGYAKSNIDHYTLQPLRQPQPHKFATMNAV